MNRMVHARLDPKCERILSHLHLKTGWGDSEIIRKGIQILASITLTKEKREIFGIGKFKSERDDLGSNKIHLKNFGKS